MSDDSEFEDWVQRNGKVVLMLIAALGESVVRHKWKMLHWHMIAVLVARVGVEAAGLSLSYLIDGKEGTANWTEYSNRVFGGPLSIGGVTPDPKVMVDIGVESAVMIILDHDEFTVPRLLSRGMGYPAVAETSQFTRRSVQRPGSFEKTPRKSRRLRHWSRN